MMPGVLVGVFLATGGVLLLFGIGALYFFLLNQIRKYRGSCPDGQSHQWYHQVDKAGIAKYYCSRCQVSRLEDPW